MAALLLCACASRDDELQQHAEKMVSLRATANAIAKAWLEGDVSGTYAGTALDQTFRLVEQERAAVAKTPDALAEPRANALVRDGERLARVISALTRDVSGRDGANARRHLADLTTSTPENP